MDPFSIVVGAVALTETANKLAGALTDRYKAFSSAPKQMVEIAGQITLCAGLVDVFAKSVDGTGRPFPRMFESDAASLVRQCRAVLSEIDAMVPHGSAKPDYQQRLRYAFRDEKRIIKHQDRLKQIQHMFMFMTTCWMYQLAPPQQTRQLASFNTTDIPRMGFQDPQHFPMQLDLKGFGEDSMGISYEATLTLTPSTQSQLGSGVRLEKERTERNRIHEEEAPRLGKITLSEAQEESLENMRRSPYFSLELLRSPIEETERYRSTEPDYEKRLASLEIEAKKLEDAKNGERRNAKVQEYREFEPTSREEAKKNVGSLISQWLSDDYKAPDNEFYPAYSEPDGRLKDGYSTPTPRTPIETYSPIDHRSSDPFEPSEIDFGHVIPASSRRSFSQVSSSPPLRRAVGVCDWRCDGCDGKFFYRESRLKCQQCVDFDFCPGCFETVSHRHPKSSFARISG
ncbi:hypothetical protein PZA11_004521 [Diplocarpon coronariae]